MKTSTIAAAGAVLACSYMLARWNLAPAAGGTEADDATADAGTVTDAATAIVEDLMATANSLLGRWRPPAQYADAIAQAESTHGIPRDILARLLWQESRYRPDIITGAVRSPAGALGIAQFMPATAREMGIDPLDPWQAIDGAARYLSQLYGQFGTWAQALAAYNWGPGNVRRKGLGAAPAETRNYFASILRDVNAANSEGLA